MWREIVQLFVAAVTIILGTVGYAIADVPEEFTVDVTSMETLAGTVLAALAVLWVIRKLIKTTNRS